MTPAGSRARVRGSAVALLVAAGCGGGAPPERLLVGLPELTQPALAWVAQAEGRFAAHGLAVEVRRFSIGRDALAALRRGEVDVAIAFDTPVLLQAAAGPGLEVLTEVHESTRDQRVIARRDHGVAAAEDLLGKRIGVSLNTSAEYFNAKLLSFAGVPLDGVTLVDVAPGRLVDALAAGEVDAIVAWCPHAQRARRALGARAVELNADFHATMSMVVTRSEIRRERRGALVRFVAALADAERLAAQRPDVALAALRRALPDIPEEDLREEWTRFRPRLGISNVLATLLAREAEWSRARGGSPVDVRGLLQPEILLEIDPEAVTLLDRGEGP